MIAVIMCGGMGTRMRPITEIIPKPLLQVGGRVVLDILIQQLIATGVETIYLTLGYKSEMIVEFIDKMNYPLPVVLVNESSPLGTAGGLKNAVGDTLEDIIVLSGDNIFNFDLKEIYRRHLQSGADVSIVGTYRDDPRDYGTMLIDDNNQIISFVEKPSWAQAESNIINTGIYIMKGSVISLIPEDQMFDLAVDLFPVLMQENYLLHCILTDGAWGDLGDMSSYLNANRDVLSDLFGHLVEDDKLISENKILSDGTIIIAPCSIGNNVSFGGNCKIGPFCTIGNNCSIGNNANIENSIISDGCRIGSHFYCSGAFLGEYCKIDSCVTIEENAVLAGHDFIGSYISVSGDCRMDPGCQLCDDSVQVHGKVKSRGTMPHINAWGVRETLLSDFTVIDAFSVGCAVASCNNLKRVGIGRNEAMIADIYKRAVILGMQASGGTVYDFDIMFRSQRVFFSDYCNLDAFVFIENTEDKISISLCGKSGSPLNRTTERLIIANFRYNTTPVISENQCNDIFFMHPIAALYNSLFIHRLPKSDHSFNVAIACDNRTIYELLCKALQEKEFDFNYGGVLFMIDKYGEKFYAIENDHAFSYDRILTICCQHAFETGKDVVVMESAPGILESLAEKYHCRLFRLYEGEKEAEPDAVRVLSENSWVVDGLSCIAQLIRIMQQTKKNIQQLSDSLPDCYVKNYAVKYEGSPKTFRKSLERHGAVRSQTRDGYYEWEDERGCIRMKSDAGCQNIKVIIEAESIELSRELSADADEKIKNCAIDKFC